MFRRFKVDDISIFTNQILGFISGQEANVCILDAACKAPVTVCTWVDILFFQDIVNDSLAVFQSKELVQASIANAWEFSVSSVVVGNNDKFLIRSYFLTLVFQVADTASVWVNRFSFAVVFIWLGHVELIGHAIDDVKVVGPVVRVDKLLRLFASWVDRVELTSRHFQPFLELGTSHLEDGSDIIIEIKVSDVLDSDWASWDICVGSSISACPRLKWCRSREDWKVGFWSSCQLFLSIPNLCIVHDLDRWIILHKGKVASDWSRSGSDLLADVFDGSFMRFFRNLGNALISYF